MMKKLFLLLLMLVIGSCVGEIDSSLPKTTQTADGPTIGGEFPGVFEVNGVAQDKVEVFFDEVTSTADPVTYIIYLGDSAVPEYVDGLNLIKEYRGKFLYTLNNLERDQLYSIKVEAINNVDGTIYPSSNIESGQTFSNLVSDFHGISTVRNLSGPAGLDTIEVRFFQALKDNSSIFAFPDEPVAYEITAINQNLLTPGQMHDPTLGPTDGRYVTEVAFQEGVNEITVGGLPSGTDFFVGMRCIHDNSLDDVTRPFLRSELNTVYREITTLTPGLGNITFDTQSFVVAKGAGEFANSSVRPSWGEASGVFDHFRVYFAISPLSPSAALPGLPADCSTIGAPVGATPYNCKKFDPAGTSGLITGLISDTTYNFVLVICETVTCGPGERIIANEVSQTTTPNVASFGGITTLELAVDVSDLGSIFINYGTPDFSNGFFDGLMVGFNTDGANVLPPAGDLISEPSNTTSMSVVPFDYKTAGRVEVQGVDYTAPGNFCFSLIPFNFDGGGSKVPTATPIFTCIDPFFQAPTALEFPGAVSASTSDYDLTVLWTEPPQGIFSHYEIYLKKTGLPFSFSTGINEAFNDPVDNTNYDRYFVPRGNSTFPIPNLDVGTYYVGVITFYIDGLGNTYRSEFNDNIYTCVIAAAPSANVCTPL